ncbi:septum formation family protein [Kibdelosporangium lantanae]|uniref:Septum formation family protein n=1 Tax=Kibdelosporangium lantanae TaxID=1497396 RepID=A0ABW3M6T5_9PSEU
MPLGAVPSPYPGEDQTASLARFGCVYAQAQHGVDKPEYDTVWAYPGREDWNTGDRVYENYETCVVHRVDDQSLPHQRLTDPSRIGAQVAVTLDMYYGSVWADPPVGVCVQAKDPFLADVHKVPIVDCTQPHWGQVLGYPVVYDVTTAQYPGAERARQDMDAACGKLASANQLGGQYRINAVPPGDGWWDNSHPEKKAYGICVLSRTDDGPMTAPVK